MTEFDEYKDVAIYNFAYENTERTVLGAFASATNKYAEEEIAERQMERLRFFRNNHNPEHEGKADAIEAVLIKKGLLKKEEHEN